MIRKFYIFTLLALAFGLPGLFNQTPTANAAAAAFVVTKAADAPDANPGDGKCKSTVGGCTLRAAVQEANANSGTDTIYLKQGITFALNNHIMLQSDMAILGAGVDSSIIRGPGQANPDNLFEIEGNVDVVMMDVTLENGVQEEGGALRLDTPSSLWLEHVTLRNNTATFKGGAIMNYGHLTVVESTLSGNTADAEDGGAIYNSGTLDLYRSTLNDNRATLRHGGALANNGTANVVDATFGANQAGDHGGAIFVMPSKQVHLYNTTVAFNKADIDNDDTGDGGGIHNNTGTVTLANSMVVHNTIENGMIDPYDDCGGALVSEGHNVVRSVTSCNFLEPEQNNVLDGKPSLGALKNNGGRTATYALKANSLGIDLGDPNRCEDPQGNEIPSDQRGYARSVDGNAVGGAYCDVGSFEFNAPDPCQFKPNAPAMAAPANNASSKQRVWLVSWSAAPCADSYKVTIKQDSKGGTTSDQISGMVGTHFVTKGLPKHHTYYAQLQACNAHGCAKAAWVKFTVN